MRCQWLCAVDLPSIKKMVQAERWLESILELGKVVFEAVVVRRLGGIVPGVQLAAIQFLFEIVFRILNALHVPLELHSRNRNSVFGHNFGSAD